VLSTTTSYSQTLMILRQKPYILGKEFFYEEIYAVTTETVPSSHPDQSLRRVDIKVSAFHPVRRVLRIILLCEVKRAGGSQDAVEAQLQQACEACARDSGDDVWGMAAVGTAAKIFHQTTTNAFWPVTTGYLDVGTPQAQDYGMHSQA